MTRWCGWREATQQALYGDSGFFRSGAAVPAAHFRTSVHASPLFAAALLRLARSSNLTTVVDIGAGGGELLTTLHHLAPDLHLVGVDLARRPDALDEAIEWRADLPAPHQAQRHHCLLVANEWLDNVPVDVVEMTVDGWRPVLVDTATGAERLGDLPSATDLAWLDAWWPAGNLGHRAEVGWPRDEAWAATVASMTHGLAVAIDYAHVRATRPARGSLTGYRAGQQVVPVPDGGCDVTAHVALDACAAAGARAGASATREMSQRAALRALGVRRERPEHALSRTDPAGYLAALAELSQAVELTDPHGLGGFGWLVQSVGLDMPAALSGTES